MRTVSDPNSEYVQSLSKKIWCFITRNLIVLSGVAYGRGRCHRRKEKRQNHKDVVRIHGYYNRYEAARAVIKKEKGVLDELGFTKLPEKSFESYQAYNEDGIDIVDRGNNTLDVGGLVLLSRYEFEIFNEIIETDGVEYAKSKKGTTKEIKEVKDFDYDLASKRSFTFEEFEQFYISFKKLMDYKKETGRKLFKIDDAYLEFLGDEI